MRLKKRISYGGYMLEEMKARVYRANTMLKKYGIVILNEGSVSEIDQTTGYVVIRPSGVSYEKMTPNNMVVVDLEGKRIEGDFAPAADTPTHLELYKRFCGIGGISRTYSKWATVFAQCGMAIPVLGTAHSSSFFGPVPCTRKLSDGEVFGKYETEIGRVVAELFTNETVVSMPAVLVHSHGPITWGGNAIEAVERSVLLEQCAMMAWHTLMLNPFVSFQDSLLKKHALYNQNDSIPSKKEEKKC